MLKWVKRLFSVISSGRHRLHNVAFEGEEGSVDLAIPIVETFDTSTGSVSIRVLGNTYAGEVGFDIEVLPDWEPQEIDDGRLIFYWGTVRYKSTGAASDRFLALLVKHYELPAINLTMKGVIEFTAVGIHSDPRNLKTARVFMKLFLDKGPEDNYAEVFTNLDLENQRIEFREKDCEYRSPLVRGLSI